MPIRFLALVALFVAWTAPAAFAGPVAYLGGPVLIEIKGSGEQTVEIGPLTNMTDGALGGFSVWSRPWGETDASVRSIEVLDEAKKVLAEFRFDDDGDGVIQEGEKDAKDDDKSDSRGLSVGVAASIRAEKVFFLKISVVRPAAAQFSWQGARSVPGGLPGPLVGLLAEVNSGSGTQEADIVSKSGIPAVDLLARNVEPKQGLESIAFEAPLGTTIVKVTSPSHRGNWDPALRAFVFFANVPTGATAHVVVTLSPPSEPVTNLRWVPTYAPPAD